MIYPIIVYGSPVLRQVARDIMKGEPELEKLVADMWETMYHSDGIGLAAPQIGKSIRLFVIDTSDLSEDDPALDGFKKVFINARIIQEWGDDFKYTEGCLSLPKIREDLWRKSKIRIEYLDENWNIIEEEYDGIKARVIQHEYDHLEGKLLIDHLNPLKRKMLKARLIDISNCRVDVDYKIKVLK